MSISENERRFFAAVTEIPRQLNAIALALDDIRLELKKSRYDEAEKERDHAGAD